MIGQLKEYIQAKIGWMPLLFSLMYAMKILGFITLPMDAIIYGLLIVTASYFLSKGAQFDRLTLALILFIPLSLVLASPDSVFRSWLRYGLFVVLLLVVSPLLNNEFARLFRYRIMHGTLLMCTSIAVLSFIGYFFGINYMRNQYTGGLLDYMVNTAGTFGGLTTQSMLLGPISGFGVLTCTYYALTREQYKKYFYLLAAMCAGSMLFAASRSALIATICGEMALYYFFSASKSDFTKRIVTILFIGAITYPLWNSALDGINTKNKGNLGKSLNTDSRSEKWRIRLAEFSDSPVWGIGFVAVSNRDNYNKSNGIIEPGSSWLAVLSMTGFIGFALFCVIFFRACKRTLLTHTARGALLGGLLILVGVHMLGEGHVFSGGSYLCFLVWLTIGVCTDYIPEGDPLDNDSNILF